MQFVNIPVLKPSIDEMVIKLTGRTMVSLFEILSNKRFGLIEETITPAERKKKLAEYAKMVRKNNGQVFIDSGGYSIITSNLNYYDIEEYEEFYQDFLANDSDLYDYIFSLDIPYGIQDERLQDRQTIQAFNHRVLDRSFKVLDKNPALKEKFIFVYHFRMLDLWEVWQKLYEDLDIGKKIIHRSIGGMVGLRGLNRHQEFVTFTFIVFRLFCDFVQSGAQPEEFRIHLLGVNHPIDRFLIAIMEKAFNMTIGSNTKVTFSYDSVRYHYDSWKKFNKVTYWDVNNYELVSNKILNVPNETLKKVYPSDLDLVKNEIENHRKGAKLKDSSLFIPLSIHSQMLLDQYFMNVVDELDIVNRMDKKQDSSIDKFKQRIAGIKEDLFENYKGFFKRDKKKKKSWFEQRIEDELSIVAGLINWLKYVNDPEKLEKVTRAEIEKMRT